MDCQSITGAYKANLHNNVDVPVVVYGLWSLQLNSISKWRVENNAIGMLEAGMSARDVLHKNLRFFFCQVYMGNLVWLPISAYTC